MSYNQLRDIYNSMKDKNGIVESEKMSIELNKIYSYTEEEKLYTFGVDYLDKSLLGIAKDDLIVVCARSGVGKTSFCTNLALKNTQLGVRVLYYALEASPLEIESRMIYSIWAKEFYKKYSGGPMPEIPRFVEWKYHKYTKYCNEFQPHVEDEIKKLKGLSVYYRKPFERFTAKDFYTHLKSVYMNYDLIILDHIHYFDKSVMAQDEMSHLSEATKIILDISYNFKPIIVVAHVRKSSLLDKTSLLPTIEDIHGSSEIAKNAKKVIIIGSVKMQCPEPKKFSTVFKIAKAREAGETTRNEALVMFDSSINDYEKKFTLGYMKSNEDFVQEKNIPNHLRSL